jgi:FAD/FMN-containing dehydrogenase
MRLICGEAEIRGQLKVKRAFDPKNLANPGKMFPRLEEAPRAA